MICQWCANVNRSKVDPMNAVAAMIPHHLDGIASRSRTRRTNGFVKALDGILQSAKRKARYGTFKTARTVFFLLAVKLGFFRINPHPA